MLRREYTGPSMIVNLILVMLYFGPLAAKGAGLWGVSELQAGIIAVVNRTGTINIKVRCGDPDAHAIVVTFKDTELEVPCRSMPMWKLMLGFGGPYGLLMPILSCVLILYQVARYLLTRQVSLIRDAEERSLVSHHVREHSLIQGYIVFIRLLMLSIGYLSRHSFFAPSSSCFSQRSCWVDRPASCNVLKCRSQVPHNPLVQATRRGRCAPDQAR